MSDNNIGLGLNMVSYCFFVFWISCDYDDEKLLLKYIVEWIWFYVLLKLEKKIVMNCLVERNILLKYMVEWISCDCGINEEKKC